jgi:S-formylglutathione hydrolase FrmB
MRRLGAVLALIVAAGAIYLVVTRLLSTNQHGAHVLHFTIDSRLVHKRLGETLVLPAHSSGRGRPLLVFLHGKGGDQNSTLTDAMFAALAAQGSAAPDVVFPNGGGDSYWHRRSSGDWARYVVDEVLPRALALSGADSRRVAIGGISMGGFGALDIARLYPRRFCAIGAHSAAVWFHGADTAPGAFDDAADFKRNDMIALARRSNPYGRTPLWIDVGRTDPFASSDTALARELRAHHAHVRFTLAAGGHDSDYWSAHWPSYMRFYARALARC